jgi:KaiC/GvpD/RAD55 family RecA-like ATPase
MIERVSSGIPGLDKLISGGFVKNSVNLISGTTGTGKTIFGLQYIWHGLQKGENGVFITLEQEPEEIFADVEFFGWDFKKYIKKKKCIIEYMSTWDVEELPITAIDRINEIKAKRFVLDTISPLFWIRTSKDEVGDLRILEQAKTFWCHQLVDM